MTKGSDLIAVGEDSITITQNHRFCYLFSGIMGLQECQGFVSTFNKPVFPVI